MRYMYQSKKLAFSVDIKTLDGCCGVASITRMGIERDATTTKAQRTIAYRKAFNEWLYDSGWGMAMCTDVTPDSDDAWGAAYDFDYERNGHINLYDFAVANNFKATKPCPNPNTDNDIVLFTKEIPHDE